MVLPSTPLPTCSTLATAWVPVCLGGRMRGEAWKCAREHAHERATRLVELECFPHARYRHPLAVLSSKWQVASSKWQVVGGK